MIFSQDTQHSPFFPYNLLSSFEVGKIILFMSDSTPYYLCDSK